MAKWRYVAPDGIEQNPLYVPLKSVEGETVGHMCAECGRLSTAQHLEACKQADPAPHDVRVCASDRGNEVTVTITIELDERWACRDVLEVMGDDEIIDMLREHLVEMLDGATWEISRETA